MTHKFYINSHIALCQYKEQVTIAFASSNAVRLLKELTDTEGKSFEGDLKG